MKYVPDLNRPKSFAVSHYPAFAIALPPEIMSRNRLLQVYPLMASMYPVPPVQETLAIFISIRHINVAKRSRKLTFEIHLKRLRHLQHALDMGHAQRLILMHRQSLRRPRQILDLPSIDVPLREVVVVLVLQLLDLHALDVLDLLDEHLPHRLLGLHAQLAVAQAEVDPRNEGFVERLDAVRGKKEDALEILEEAEEDADKGVAVDVVDGAFFEEDVGFVEEKERTPAVCDVWSK